MAKQRPIVGPISAPPALQPQAHPVSTYSDPLNGGGPDPKNGFRELATALANFTPGLAAYADRYVAEEQLRARADALTEAERNRNREGLAKAVKAGELPAGASPWYRKAWDQQDAEIRGHAYTNAIETWYAQSDVKNVEVSDPRWGQALDEFTNGYAKEQGLEAHPEYHAILGPMMGQARERLTAAHTQYRIQETERKVAEGADTLSRQVITDGLKSGEDPSITALTLQAIANRNIQNGQSPLKANEIAVGAIINEAQNNLNPETLDLLDQFDTGNGKLGNVGWVKDLRAKAEESIYRNIAERGRLQAAMAKQRQDEEEKNVLGAATDKLIDDPMADIKDELKQMNRVNPEKVEKILSAQGALIHSADNVLEDPKSAVELTAKVYEGLATKEDILEAIGKRKISRQTGKKLVEDIPRAQEFRSILRDSTLSQMHKTIGDTIRGGDGLLGKYDDGRALNAAYAQNAFIEDIDSFKRAHPNATSREIREEALRSQDALFKHYLPEAADAAKITEPLPAEQARDYQAGAGLDPSKQPFFANRAEFEDAVKQANESNGTAGPLVELASRYSMKPRDFAALQDALIKKSADAVKTKPKGK